MHICRPQPDCHSVSILRVVAYLHAHARGHAPLDELARIAGMSRFHFCRVFRGIVGTSPGEYARRLRLERAKPLLASGESATRIAHSLGFADQSHCTRAFKAFAGISPGHYARSSRQAAAG